MINSAHHRCPACRVALDGPNAVEPSINAIQGVGGSPKVKRAILDPLTDGTLLGFHFQCRRCGYQWTEEKDEAVEKPSPGPVFHQLAIIREGKSTEIFASYPIPEHRTQQVLDSTRRFLGARDEWLELVHEFGLSIVEQGDRKGD